MNRFGPPGEQGATDRRSSARSVWSCSKRPRGSLGENERGFALISVILVLLLVRNNEATERGLVRRI